jgi:hypothetical protein
MQLVAGPWSWQAAQLAMLRRAARPWKSAEPVSDPSQPMGCGLTLPTRAALTPRCTWQASQLEVVWHLRQSDGRDRASRACRLT